MEKPLLQLALDNFDLPSALGPLQKAAPCIDIIEVGTILCLADGMRAVRIIRSLFPQKTILADVRIAEAGRIISRMAFESGADWVSVVSCATKDTIVAVREEAYRHGGDLQIELIGNWTWEQVDQWRDLGIKQIIVHRSRDAEVNGSLTWSKQSFEQITRLGEMGFDVTITGGIKVTDISCFANLPVRIFIAGRAIREANDPAAAAREFQRTIDDTFRK